MTPELLLSHADALLASAGRHVPAWPRACALLIRLALEAGLDRYWTTVDPKVVECTMRVQLLLLSRYAGQGAADLAQEAWHSLCRAVHHHTYELDPTATELRDWHHLVTDLLHRLEPEVGQRLAAPAKPGKR